MIRKKETNYGNAVILHSGSIRSDAIIEPGPLKHSTISNVFEMYLIVKYVPGILIHTVL